MDEAEELRSTIYVYYDGAVKQDVARPVTEVNIHLCHWPGYVLFYSSIIIYVYGRTKA